MILLTGASDQIQVSTSTTADLDVHASWVDNASGTITPGRKNTTINTVATTSVVPSPGTGVFRTVKTLHVRNRHATTSQTATVIYTDGTTPVQVMSVSLLPGYMLHYDEGAGFEILDAFGRSLQNSSNNGSGAAINSTNLVVLSADVTNNNATANTIADVTGLSFTVTAGEAYFFRFNIDFTSAATTTGSRWSINGPASPTRLSYSSRYALTTTTETVNHGLTAYDLPAAANASPAATGGNIAIIEGFIQPSANGTVIARFASEIASSAIVAKRGSLLEWYRVF